MKPYHNQNYPPRRPAQPPDGSETVHRYSHPIRTGRPAQRTPQRPARPVATAPAPPPPPAADLHRYSHPIRTVCPAERQAMEELMGELLEAAARQTEMLEEVLRRLERYNSDT